MWYAGHVIMIHRYVDTGEDAAQGYENVFLIQADSPDQAIDRARQLGTLDEVRSTGNWLGGRPVHLLLLGVRKVVRCLLQPGGTEVSDGIELTYNELIGDSASDVTAYMKGEDRNLTIV